jgi:hypothetical protein
MALHRMIRHYNLPAMVDGVCAIRVVHNGDTGFYDVEYWGKHGIPILSKTQHRAGRQEAIDLALSEIKRHTTNGASVVDFGADSIYDD